MEEKTADEVAAIFTAAGDSVTVINTAKRSDETEWDYGQRVAKELEDEITNSVLLTHNGEIRLEQFK